MTPKRTGIALSSVSLAGLALAARLATRPLVTFAPLAATVSHPLNVLASPRAPLDSLTQSIIGRDPFRIARRPASVAYAPEHASQPASPVPSNPVLVVTGIVWGRRGDPSAVLEGLPGVAGARVVRQGDHIGPLRVRRIERDRVVIAGLDTMWTLTVRQPWQ